MILYKSMDINDGWDAAGRKSILYLGCMSTQIFIQYLPPNLVILHSSVPAYQIKWTNNDFKFFCGSTKVISTVYTCCSIAETFLMGTWGLSLSQCVSENWLLLENSECPWEKLTSSSAHPFFITFDYKH